MFLRLLALLTAVGALMMAVEAQTPLPVTTTPPPRTITVNGSAQQMVSPDLAFVTLAIQTQGKTLSDASGSNATIANRVIQAINALKIPRLTIRTLDYNVEPIYQQPAPNQPVITPLPIIGYQVINRLEVRIPETNTAALSSAVSKVADAAVTAGANRVDSIQFTLQDMNAAVKGPLADATRNARALADTMAKAAGVQIVRVLSLSFSQYNPQPGPIFARAADSAMAPPIIAGPLTISATVNAVYEIK